MKKNILLLISGVLGLVYAIYLLVNFWGSFSAMGIVAQSGIPFLGGLAGGIELHIVCTIIAVVFNVIGFITDKRIFALLAGVMYLIAMIIFFWLAFYVLVQMILCFVASSKMKKQEKE